MRNLRQMRHLISAVNRYRGSRHTSRFTEGMRKLPQRCQSVKTYIILYFIFLNIERLSRKSRESEFFRTIPRTAKPCFTLRSWISFDLSQDLL